MFEGIFDRVGSYLNYTIEGISAVLSSAGNRLLEGCAGWLQPCPFNAADYQYDGDKTQGFSGSEASATRPSASAIGIVSNLSDALTAAEGAASAADTLYNPGAGEYRRVSHLPQYDDLVNGTQLNNTN